MSAHRAIAVGYALIAALIAFAGAREHDGSVGFALGLAFVFALIAALHGAIAFGAARRNPTARAASVALACLMLFGFPIGTLIGVYLLRNRNWAPEGNV
jgi:hypothetical protein